MSEIEGVAHSLINFKKQQAQHCTPSSKTVTKKTDQGESVSTTTTGIIPSTTVAPPISSPAAPMATKTMTNTQDCINSACFRKPVRLGPRKVSNSSVGEGGGEVQTQTGPNNPNKSRQITRRVHFKAELVILGGSKQTVITPTDPTEYDVVITRNYNNKVYLGNQRYRKLIHAYQEAYAQCSDDDDNANMKINIAGYVVDAIRKEGNGRFLKEDGSGSGVFRDIGYTRACQKTMQALRVAVDGMFQQQRLQQQHHTNYKRPIHEYSNKNSNSQSNGSLKKRMKFGPSFRKLSNPVCAPRAANEQEAEIQRILSSKHLMDEETLHRKLCEVYSRKQQQDASQQSRLPATPVVAEDGVPSSSSSSSSWSVLSMRM
uniref:DUF6824 domain-containing protein n=1 Tax=Leptocylindrus danicus TaxID=163516 RepID=A0A6U2LLU6_9STRA